MEHADVPTPLDRGPAVPFPPPLIFAAGVGLALLLERLAPRFGLPAASLPEFPARDGLGIGLMAAGALLDVTSILTFARRRTAIYPNRPATVIVDDGVFRFSRNPMYLGMAFATAGIGVFIGSGWTLLLLPLMLLAMQRLVIAREERHLTARHPEAYAAYCARVRRWL